MNWSNVTYEQIIYTKYTHHLQHKNKNYDFKIGNILYYTDQLIHILFKFLNIYIF